ncbi:plasmid partitioning protein RepB [Roseivivax sp. CAU 1761]
MKGLKENLARAREAQETGPREAPKGGYRGAVGVMGATMSEMRAEMARLQAAAPSEIDPARIRASRFRDRLDVGHGIEDLTASIEASGQRIPVLVRPLPRASEFDEPEYEIVYGRRRVEACRRLGRRVAAVISEMSEDEALIAQGLENAARLETSYVERALFAQQIREAGKSDEEIAGILGKDRAEISRMRTLMEVVPAEVIEAVGPTSAGRIRWEEVKKGVARHGVPAAEAWQHPGATPEERLEALLAALRALARGPARPAAAVAPRRLGSVAVARKGAALSLKAASKQDRGFLDYLETRLDDLHDEWSKSLK